MTTATNDQLARVGAAQTDFEIRIYVGALFRLARTDNIHAGLSFTPEANATTVTTAVTPESTSIVVASTTGFPTSGGILVGPGDTDERHEIVYYTGVTPTSFTGLIRELGDLPTQPNTGHHAIGAAVTEWVEITEYVSGPIELVLEERNSIGSWELTLKGQGYNVELMSHDRALLVMWRHRPYNGSMSAWTPWVVGCVGWISTVGVNDDSTALYNWRMTVRPVTEYLGKTKAPGLRLGLVDLGSGGGASTSSTLTDSLLEYGTGEFLGLVDLSPENVVDGDLNTLWCSQSVPSTVPPVTHSNGMRINEVLLQQPPGRQDLQFLEVFFKSDLNEGVNLKYYCLVNALTTWREEEYDGIYYSVPDNNFIDITTKTRHMDPDGAWAIWVSNRTVFDRYYKLLGGYVIDWQEPMVGAFSLHTASGFIGLHSLHTVQEDIFWYGTGIPHWYGATAHTSGYPPGWSGAVVPTPAAGHTMMRVQPGLVTDPSANAWTESTNPTPGGFDKGDDEWISVDLGEMGHKLSSALLAGELDEICLDGSMGFTDGGTVVVDAEAIEYDSVDYVNHKLLTLTRPTPSEHAIGTVVKQRESWNGSPYDYDCYLVDKVQMRRKPGLPVPTHFGWYVSPIDSPVRPTDAGWDTSWDTDWIRCEISGNGASLIEWEPATPMRCRHAMLVIHQMSASSRAKANEISAFASMSTVLIDGLTGMPLDSARSDAVIQYLLVTLFGLDADKFVITETGMVFPEITTTGATYLSVIRDILTKSGAVLYFGLDGAAEHRLNPLYPTRQLPAVDVTWDRDNVRTIDLVSPSKHNVSQVVLRAKVEKDEQVYEFRFPGEPLALGEVMVIDGRMVASPVSGLLLAEMIWKQENGPYTVVVNATGIGEWIRPGDRHVVDWTLDTSETILSGRNFVVQRVTHSIDLPRLGRGGYTPGQWSTSVTLREMIF